MVLINIHGVPMVSLWCPSGTLAGTQSKETQDVVIG